MLYLLNMGHDENWMATPPENLFAEGSNELNTVERETIHKIENLPITAADQASILLVWSGAKPATIIDYQLTEKDLNQEYTDSDSTRMPKISKLMAEIEYLDLFVSYIATIDLKTGLALNNHLKAGDSVQFAIAKDEATAKIVQEEQTNRFMTDKPVDNVRLGKALGYPETAVKAYQAYEDAQKQYRDNLKRHIRQGPFPQQSDYIMDRSEIPEQIRESPFLINSISSFAFSKSHWQEELELKKAWSDTVERMSPNIYHACLNRK